MAEAHAAVAFHFTVERDRVDIGYNQQLLRALLFSLRRRWRKWFRRKFDNFRAGLYPAGWRSCVAFFGASLGLSYVQVDWSYGFVGYMERKVFGTDWRGHVLSTGFATLLAWFGFVKGLRYTKRLLFRYQGWMYERPPKLSYKTKTWMAIKGFLTFFISRKPMLNSFQGMLPYLPVPSLEDTIRRHLKSVEPLVTKEKYDKMVQEADEFKKGIGRKLQWYLIAKSWISKNYVTDWWEEYVYLRGRSPIMINSNYYGLDALFFSPTTIQAARAANLVHACFMFRRQSERNDIKPLMIPGFGVPLCSVQYERMFNTSRLPGVNGDFLCHWDDSRHVAVYSKGCWYKMPVYEGNTLLKPPAIEKSIQSIIDAKDEPVKGEKLMAALTAGEREPWAQARKKYFSKANWINHGSLHIIERAAFVLVLDDVERSYDPKDDSKLDQWAHGMLHGEGHDRWFDKTFNLIISKNAKAGINAEHSWADAPVMGHLMEVIAHWDHFLLGYTPDGHTQGEIEIPAPPPQRLNWDLPDECCAVIESSYKTAVDLIKDVEMALLIFRDYGKGFIKTCKVSPDAYLQMALQLTYFRDQGKFCLTYESSMTRLFREGRTETVRTVTKESCDFVRSMEDESKTNEERIALLRMAGDRHQQSYRDSMVGKGVDRHLFCLYVISRYLGLEVPYLKEILFEPWRLSTSQTPQQQTDLIDLKKNPEHVAIGGGFGPVAHDGYGVSYIIGGEDMVSFHISSKNSSPVTNSKRFREMLKKSLHDIRKLFPKKVVEPGKN